jgi:hypothetical protein
VDLHGRSYVGVVHLNALDVMLDNELSPMQINDRLVVQHGKDCIKAVESLLGLLGSQPKTVLVCRPGAHIPEFGNVLREYADGFVFGKKYLNGLERRLTQGMPLLNTKNQDVGIEENCHSSVSLVDIFAADALERKCRKIWREALSPSLKRLGPLNTC